MDTDEQKRTREINERMQKWVIGLGDAAMAWIAARDAEIETLRKQLEAALSASGAHVDQFNKLSEELAALKQGQGEPVGYLPAYELDRIKSGHSGNLRAAKFGPSALDGDVPLYTAAPTIPAGYVLVPVEPTGSMVAAFNREFYKRPQSFSQSDCYRAMLAAAPKQGETPMGQLYGCCADEVPNAPGEPGATKDD